MTAGEREVQRLKDQYATQLREEKLAKRRAAYAKKHGKSSRKRRIRKSKKPWWHVDTFECRCADAHGLCGPCKVRLTEERKAELIAKSSRKSRKNWNKRAADKLVAFNTDTTGNEDLDKELGLK